MEAPIRRSNQSPGFQDRLRIGELAENKVLSYLMSKCSNIATIYSTKTLDGWTPLMDSVEGDIHIVTKFRTYKFDVKVMNNLQRAFISQRSSENFSGDGYIFMTHTLDISKAFFVPANSIKAYMRKVAEDGHLKEAPSGDKGFSFNPYKMWRSEKFVFYVNREIR